MIEEIEKLKKELGDAVHNECETAMLLEEARERIKQLEAKTVAKIIHKHENQPNECGGVQIVYADGTTGGCAMEFNDVSEMYAKASYEAQEYLYRSTEASEWLVCLPLTNPPPINLQEICEVTQLKIIENKSGRLKVLGVAAQLLQIKCDYPMILIEKAIKIT